MNERELRQLVAKRKNAYDDAVKEGKSVEELRGLVDELKEAREKLDLEIEARSLDNPIIEDPIIRNNEPEEKDVKDLTDDEVESRYVKVFLKGIRGKNINNEDREIFERVKEIRKFQSNDPAGTGEDGGLILPADVQTQINELRRNFQSLEDLITVENVTTKTGSRVLEKLADITPFANIEEWDEIGEVENSQFTNMSFDIKNYAGILPIPNTMLQDTDQNLLSYVYKWIAKKSIVTRNTKILEVLKSLTQTAEVKDVDSLKDVFNTVLDPALLTTSGVVTNQSGFNFLDKLKDNNGKYILQPDPVNATVKMLFGTYPVTVVGNRFLPDEVGKAPIFMGDLKEAVVLFDRNIYEVEATSVGGKSFGRYTTDVRVIDRFDVQKWDDGAAVFGTIATGSAPATTKSAK